MKPVSTATALALVLDLVRVRVAADMIAGLEHRDLVLAVQVVRGDVAGDAAADDGDLHEHSSSALRGGAVALSGHCCGTRRELASCRSLRARRDRAVPA